MCRDCFSFHDRRSNVFAFALRQSQQWKFFVCNCCGIFFCTVALTTSACPGQIFGQKAKFAQFGNFFYLARRLFFLQFEFGIFFNENNGNFFSLFLEKLSTHVSLDFRQLKPWGSSWWPFQDRCFPIPTSYFPKFSDPIPHRMADWQPGCCNKTTRVLFSDNFPEKNFSDSSCMCFTFCVIPSRHLQRNPEHQFNPLFQYFENWCQDETRHGDFLAAVLKTQPTTLQGWYQAFGLPMPKAQQIPPSCSGESKDPV